MPNTKKRGGGAGNGPGGGARAPAAVLTAEDVSLATKESEKLYKKLVDDIRVSNPIIQEDLINYLLNTYNTQRIGLQSVVLPGLEIFLNVFTPELLTSQKTSTFCKELFGFKSTEFRELLTRNSGNVTQCGKGGYIRNLPMVCIWCGEPIFDMAECEHSLPITPCAGLLGFSSNPDRPKIEHLLEYGYAHRLCNQVKLDVSFLTWSDKDTKWGINWENMSAVYDKISRSGPRYKNAQLLAYYLDKKTNKLINTLGTDIPIKNDAVGAPNDERKGNYDLSNPADIRIRNNLTEGGEHRNKDEIKIACGELASSTANFYNKIDILAGGAKQKKSKKKQRGGVRKTATTATTAKTTECKLSNIDTLLTNEGALKKYLSQDLRTPDGAKWLKEPRFYGPYRMKLIEEYCNRYTKLLGPPGNPGNLKYTVLARIVTSPRTEDLAKGFSGAFPANPAKEAEDEKQLLQFLLVKKIRNFNTYNFNIGSIISLRARAQARRVGEAIPALEYLKEEKQRQFTEIEQLIRDHNTKHPTNTIGETLNINGNKIPIPIDANSKIDKIEEDIIQLMNLPAKGGGKLIKMKGGMREAFYSAPEIAGLKEFILRPENEPFTYFESIELESLEVYNQINMDITSSITELVKYKEEEEEEEREVKFYELLDKLLNIKVFLPELDEYNPEGITLDHKSIIFAAIIFTNESININYKNKTQVREHLTYLYNRLFNREELRRRDVTANRVPHEEDNTARVEVDMGSGVFDPTFKSEGLKTLRAITTARVFPDPEGFLTPVPPLLKSQKGFFAFRAGGYKGSGGSRKKITINRKNTKKLNKRKN